MRKLTRLLTLLILAALGWGIYWFVGASATERRYSDWLTARQAEGWQAEATTLATHGFPNRFDTTFEGITLADPDTQVAWSAPLFQILSLSYRPTHIIAVWPGTQRFSTPDRVFDITAESMRGSLKMTPAPKLPLESQVLEIAGAVIESSSGHKTQLDAAQLAMRVTPETAEPGLYDLHLSITGLTPDPEFTAGLVEIADLPAVIEGVTIEAQVLYDKPWDITALEVARPQPRRVSLTQFSARWGALDLQAEGALSISVDGLAMGEVALKATNWREMIAVAEATGAMSAAMATATTRGLELVAGLSGDPDVLDVPLTFERGFTFIGPVPVGPAPVIRLP